MAGLSTTDSSSRPTAAGCSTPTASRSSKAASSARVGRTTEATPLPVNNRTVLHLLEALQVLQVRVPGGGPAEARRLSFRALDIEQIGHVYEGLLDHTAKRAAEPVPGPGRDTGQGAGNRPGRIGEDRRQGREGTAQVPEGRNGPVGIGAQEGAEGRDRRSTRQPVSHGLPGRRNAVEAGASRSPGWCGSTPSATRSSSPRAASSSRQGPTGVRAARTTRPRA